MNKYSELITAIFFLLAVVAIILYFVMPNDRTWFYLFGGVAVLIRIIQYIMRLFGSQKKKHEIPDDLK